MTGELDEGALKLNAAATVIAEAARCVAAYSDEIHRAGDLVRDAGTGFTDIYSGLGELMGDAVRLIRASEHLSNVVAAKAAEIRQ